MAQRILNVEFPTVNPSGATSASGENIPTSPNMFGGFGAQAEERAGQGLERAGNAVVDFATEKQAQLNAVDAAQRHTDAVKQMTDVNASYLSTEGHAALLGRPDHDAKIKGIYDDAVAGASNDAVKRTLATTLSGDLDRYYNYSARHAAQQETVYSKKVAADKTLDSMDQAVWAYRNGDFRGWENYRKAALEETRNTYLHDLDPNETDQGRIAEGRQRIEAEVAKTNGKIVFDTTKIILDQPRGGPDKADQFAKRYEKEVDAATNVKIDDMLKSARATQAGQAAANEALGRTRGSRMPPPGSFISDTALRWGIDPTILNRSVQIESGGNPRAQTGSYKGLLQLSQSEFDKYKPRPDASIWNPQDNLEAGAAKMKAEGAQFARNFGREPTGFDSYMIHQQGLAGYSAHLANPNAPAWQNMLSTWEGQQKGAGWAQKAIWGNIPDQYKATFGNVNNVSSRDFLAMWQQKFEGEGGAFTPSQAAFQGGGGGESAQPAAVAGPSTAHTYDYRAAEGEILDDPNLSEQAKVAGYAHINRVKQITEGQAADEERAQRMAEHAAKVASDNAEQAALHDIYSNRPTLTAPQIIDSPVLSREAKERLITQLGKADTGEHAERTYGPGFFDAYKAVHAPAGDPGRITDPSQLYGMVGPHGSLTVAGVDKLVSEISARKTPEGEAESSMKKQFFEHVARPQITFTDEALKLKDQDGDARFLRFQAAAFNAYDEGKKAGKTPMQLLNPDSPDYVGKLIEQFKPPADQAFANRLQDASSNGPGFWSRVGTAIGNIVRPSAAPAPAPFDISKVNSLSDLQAAYRDRRISAEEARKMAIERGWAKAAAGAVPTPHVPNPTDDARAAARAAEEKKAHEHDWLVDRQERQNHQRGSHEAPPSGDWLTDKLNRTSPR